jgi:fructosamine-3-kinase
MREELPLAVERALGAAILKVRAIGGGDICRARRIDVSSPAGRERYFLKSHDAPPPGFFAREAEGLTWLAECPAVAVPRVCGWGETWLLLEWVPEAEPRDNTEEEFGRALAQLHARGAEGWGFRRDNYIGTLPQSNRRHETWREFYREERLLPLLRHPRVSALLDEDDRRDFDRLFEVLDDRAGPEPPPARLHGDLWGGNRIIGPGGRSWLVDPAVYAGHPEMDLAMMRLFGGFGERAFSAYAEVAPLYPGARERLSLWQLYPWLVHVALFGAGYLDPLRRGLASQL